MLGENRSIVEELRDAHDLVHADQALALLALARGHAAEGEALLGDTAARITRMGREAMGRAYAMALADIYRRGSRPALAAALLRHALSLLDAGQNPAEYDAARTQLAALEATAADETRAAPTTLSAIPQQVKDQP